MEWLIMFDQLRSLCYEAYWWDPGTSGCKCYQCKMLQLVSKIFCLHICPAAWCTIPSSAFTSMVQTNRVFAGVIATTRRALLTTAHLCFVYLSLSAKLHVLHPLTVALKLCQRLPLHPLMQLHRLLQRLDPPLQVHLIADLTLVLEQTWRLS